MIHVTVKNDLGHIVADYYSSHFYGATKILEAFFNNWDYGPPDNYLGKTFDLKISLCRVDGK